MRALLRRLGVYILAAWVALTVSFLLPRVVPGNPVAGAVARASQSGNCNSACVVAVEEQLGFNVHTSLWDQYLQYWGNLRHGNLGQSWSENAPVSSLIVSYLPWTLGLLVVATVYCVFPIYFMLVQSLKTAQEDVFGNPLIVVNPTFENFEELFERTGEARGFVGSVLRRNYPVLEWLENTVVVFAGSVTVTLVASILAAYALGRLRPPGFRWWRRAIFATYVIPHTILFVPLYQVILHLHLDDNLLALLLVYPTLALPFCVWILSAYFQQFPREVEESALVEGASRVTAFVRIILPMSRSVIVAAGIFTVGTIASDFTLASVFLLDAHNQTIPAGLGTMDVALDELLAVAGINLMAIPVVLICAVFARGYVRGLTAAMVEGA